MAEAEVASGKTSEVTIPDADSAASDWETFIHALRERHVSLDAPIIESLFALCRRLLGNPNTGIELRQALESARDALGAALEEIEEQDQREQVRKVEGKQPLRRRILSILAYGDASPGELKERLEARSDSLSKALRTLQEQGLVGWRADVTDARSRIYSLTSDGSRALSRHRVFGAVEAPPASLSPNQETGLLYESLRAAVSGRRRNNDLEASASSFAAIIEEAEARGLEHLALRARREYIVTLRQAGCAEILATQLAQLAEIAGGLRDGFGSECVQPALAHLAYERGRHPEPWGEDSLDLKAQHLVTARSIYRDLTLQTVSEDWKEREGWALASLADNFREQSDLRRAYVTALRALQIFERIGDSYGGSRCHFLLGFCLRLSGHFERALQALQLAHNLADSEGFERFQTDALMQLGETHRCLGEHSKADEALQEAISMAESLEMPTTLAFGTSSLGATQFARKGDPSALDVLEKANRLFEKRHMSGWALTLRRMATVARECQVRDRTQIERRLERALTIYRTLNSPPGMMACRIEMGRIRRQCGADVTGVNENLLSSCRPLAAREIIECDPWVPHLLLSYAKDVGEEPLQEAAESIVDDSSERLAHLLDTGAAADEGNGEERDNPADPQTIEMGGESPWAQEPQLAEVA